MDEAFMRRAIALARANLGRTGDNPSVGCVIVKDGEIVGEGATAEGGRPHAEEAALAQAGGKARGAMAYVTLEPCASRSAGGKSCSERLVEAGVARVAVACDDASIHAAGAGAQRLRDAGIAVEGGLLADEAGDLYESYRPREA
ncbi:bifunctional diaminohydroxyphosphoribosylaminopyrimidine deaminase/5-amino-6-(5-phosphoribosylamino)uracil reductase RibD [Phenylobacterium sp. J367]|uniref:bifunctional diaminohydroxyphosphoribosylaminopyrimidine deaminase/5-amino-6-(5-phosphoribosylamino)uracil reductase RibD n=1 Tax=Phenylobacterium sp. J367 TaxID=2898435 RepID=UPI0021511AD9|nr:bifunctional diaminohydroxyphosphoribosylaminopyrimidine deaminase/5-amino-6-(5-phosphoribosylamino)uracil reductase RibD [Phenylobacterium sp. J367]MCR5878675.1 bifunctional diaminohydroxyphosphoribosylaminopyrimidine deaminase/5-amino-6-(5-phosphoribosylamino)uracil reductase RibD [Phenylobacterium sp. J367]